jgi:hypothetical protein
MGMNNLDMEENEIAARLGGHNQIDGSSDSLPGIIQNKSSESDMQDLPHGTSSNLLNGLHTGESENSGSMPDLNKIDTEAIGFDMVISSNTNTNVASTGISGSGSSVFARNTDINMAD